MSRRTAAPSQPPALPVPVAPQPHPSPLPPAAGLYDPRFEHDACGVGFIARIDGKPTHQVLRLALESVANVTHRGAVGADARTGDGAGVLTLSLIHI